MHGHSIRNTRRKIWVGRISIYLILGVSLGASIAYWYILAGISTNQDNTPFWLFIIWLVVAVGLVAELIKKITLSTFRHGGIWAVATFVSVLTVMGTYSILDNNKQNDLVKQSDSYQMAKEQKAEALKKQARFAYAKNFNIEKLEQKKRVAGNKAQWGTFNQLKEDIAAKKSYDSATATVQLSTENMLTGTAGGNASSNPLLTNISTFLGFSPELIKTIFYLLVTILLEVSAFWIGGQVEKLEETLELTEAEILDRRNKAVFGMSMRDFDQEVFERVVLSQLDQQQAERAIEALRKANRKKIPALEASSQIKEIRAETQHSLEVAKQAQPTVTGVPEQAQAQAENVPKKAQPTGTKKRLKNKREAVTADTGTEGENSKRYQALKSGIVKGEVKPTFRAIQGFKYGGRGMGRGTAEKYREALEREGVIS